MRGPLSRRRCVEQGYACPEIYGDPGLLVSDLYGEDDAGTDADIGIVPHFQNLERATALFGGRDDVTVIDVRRPVGAVVADMLGCRLILSSSLHGLIVAHAFERSALHVEFDGAIPGDGIKFHDHYMSLGFEAAPDIKVLRRRDDVTVIDVRRPVGAVGGHAGMPADPVEPLHGLIVAHAFERPALHVEFDGAIPGDGIKFHDHYMSLGFEAAPDVVRIGADTAIADLRRMAEGVARPDVEPLRDPLRDACPF